LSECQAACTDLDGFDWRTLGARIRRDALVAATMHALLAAGCKLDAAAFDESQQTAGR
jgi:hypothetical protein